MRILIEQVDTLPQFSKTGSLASDLFETAMTAARVLEAMDISLWSKEAEASGVRYELIMLDDIDGVGLHMVVFNDDYTVTEFLAIYPPQKWDDDSEPDQMRVIVVRR
jgi:hypothetical protein